MLRDSRTCVPFAPARDSRNPLEGKLLSGHYVMWFVLQFTFSDSASYSLMLEVFSREFSCNEVRTKQRQSTLIAVIDIPEGRVLKMGILVSIPLPISQMLNEKWDASFLKSDFSILKSHFSLLDSQFSLLKSDIPLVTSLSPNITTVLEWKWQYVSPILISHFLYPTSHFEWEMLNVKWDVGKSQNLTF